MAASGREGSTIHVYADALFGAAKKQGVVQRVAEEAKSLADILERQPNFRSFLEGPQIPTDKKREIIDKTFKGKLTPLVLNLLYMMVDRERAFLLPSILEAFQEAVEHAEGVRAATLISAREVGFQERLRLKTALEKFTGHHLRIKYQVRPALIGGFVFRFGDTLIDGSVRHGLRKLRERLLPRREV